MSYILDIFIIVLLFALFGWSHSILASNKLKERLTEQIGDKIAFYRLFYNIISTLIFAAAYILSPKPDLVIYDAAYPYDILIVGVQVISLVGLIWTFTYIDGAEFLGLTQVYRYFTGKYEPEELDEKSSLIIKGPFLLCRHPVYLFTILFLGMRPYMDLFYLTFFTGSVIYFLIGAYYEERKLEAKYGVEYKLYKAKVPRFIPSVFSLIRRR